MQVVNGEAVYVVKDQAHSLRVWVSLFGLATDPEGEKKALVRLQELNATVKQPGAT